MMVFSLPLLSFADPVVVTIQDNCDDNVVFQIQDYNVDDDKFHSATVIGSSGASFGSFSIDPDWGTFIFSGVSISNYKGFGRITGDNTAVRTRVLDNDFTRASIDVTKIKGTTGNRLIINNNLFESPSASYSQNNFIRVLDCDNLSVSDNEIENYSSYTPSGLLSPNGILLDDATDAIVTGNTLKNVEKGIEITGLADDMQLYCNVFDTYWGGIYLDYPINFPSQGVNLTTGSDNMWTTRIVGSSTISGAVSPNVWFYWSSRIGDVSNPNDNTLFFPVGTGISATGVFENNVAPSSDNYCPFIAPSAKKAPNDFQRNDSNSELQLLSIYPNPMKDFLTIKTQSDIRNVKTCRILTIDGAVVKEFKLNETNTEVDVRDLNNGIYILQVNQNHTFKIVKIE